jgi:hypothetical protein
VTAVFEVLETVTVNCRCIPTFTVADEGETVTLIGGDCDGSELPPQADKPKAAPSNKQTSAPQNFRDKLAGISG